MIRQTGWGRDYPGPNNHPAPLCNMDHAFPKTSLHILLNSLQSERFPAGFALFQQAPPHKRYFNQQAITQMVPGPNSLCSNSSKKNPVDSPVSSLCSGEHGGSTYLGIELYLPLWKHHKMLDLGFRFLFQFQVTSTTSGKSCKNLNLCEYWEMSTQNDLPIIPTRPYLKSSTLWYCWACSLMRDRMSNAEMRGERWRYTKCCSF